MRVSTVITIPGHEPENPTIALADPRNPILRIGKCPCCDTWLANISVTELCDGLEAAFPVIMVTIQDAELREIIENFIAAGQVERIIPAGYKLVEVPL